MSSVFRLSLQPLCQVDAYVDDGFGRFTSHKAIKMAMLSTKAMFVLAIVFVLGIGAICAQASAIENTYNEREMHLQSDNITAFTTGHGRQLEILALNTYFRVSGCMLTYCYLV